MTSYIDVYTGGGTPTYTLTSTSIAGTLDTDGVFYYTHPGSSSVAVNRLEARMGNTGADDLIAVDCAPPTGESVSVNAIRTTASGTGVSSFLSWGPLSGTSVVRLTIHTPADQGTWVLWEFGAQVPAVKLKVKIIRV